MPIQACTALYCICLLPYVCLYMSGFATRDDVMPIQLPRMTHYHNNIVELLRYRRRRPTYLLADWICYDLLYLSSNHMPSGDMAPSNTPFQIQIMLLMDILCASKSVKI